jgi:RNA polymerase sigma-70 factor (ECF subfamily)
MATGAAGHALVFREHYARLVAVAAHMTGSIAVAEDLVQGAFEQYLKTGDGEIVNPGGWLTTVVTRRCLNEIRRRGREARALQRSEPSREQSDREPAFFSRPELEAALSVLSPRQRALIVLVEGVDMSVAGAAHAVGCKASTASVHLTRARRALRTHVARTQEHR